MCSHCYPLFAFIIFLFSALIGSHWPWKNYFERVSYLWLSQAFLKKSFIKTRGNINLVILVQILFSWYRGFRARFFPMENISEYGQMNNFEFWYIYLSFNFWFDCDNSGILLWSVIKNIFIFIYIILIEYFIAINIGESIVAIIINFFQWIYNG